MTPSGGRAGNVANNLTRNIWISVVRVRTREATQGLGTPHFALLSASGLRGDRTLSRRRRRHRPTLWFEGKHTLCLGGYERHGPTGSILRAFCRRRGPARKQTHKTTLLETEKPPRRVEGARWGGGGAWRRDRHQKRNRYWSYSLSCPPQNRPAIGRPLFQT